MNMAFTAGCFFILQCIFLMDVSVADPLIDVSPSEINLGITSTLDINCTFSFNNHPDMAAFVSLVLSRANSTGQNFTDLAAITQFSPDSVTLLTHETVSATGVHSQTGGSYLHVTWQYPTALQGGLYKCIAQCMNNTGYTVEMTNISLVTVDKADLNDIFEKLQQLEMHEFSMRQQIQTLENDKISMEKKTTDLEDSNSHLERVVESLARAHVDFIGNYSNKNYYLASYSLADINDAIEVCKSLGGQLAVIDNQDELTAVQGFLTATSDISNVAIAGTKAESNWVLPGTDTPLPFISWGSGFPNPSNPQICLFLYKGVSWYMANWFCHFDSPHDWVRFMCEV